MFRRRYPAKVLGAAFTQIGARKQGDLVRQRGTTCRVGGDEYEVGVSPDHMELVIGFRPDETRRYGMVTRLAQLREERERVLPETKVHVAKGKEDAAPGKNRDQAVLRLKELDVTIKQLSDELDGLPSQAEDRYSLTDLAQIDLWDVGAEGSEASLSGGVAEGRSGEATDSDWADLFDYLSDREELDPTEKSVPQVLAAIKDRDELIDVMRQGIADLALYFHEHGGIDMDAELFPQMLAAIKQRDATIENYSTLGRGLSKTVLYLSDRGEFDAANEAFPQLLAALQARDAKIDELAQKLATSVDVTQGGEDVELPFHENPEGDSSGLPSLPGNPSQGENAESAAAVTAESGDDAGTKKREKRG